MGVLDKVSQMKSQGKGDSEIISTLRAQGVSPKEIQDALSQAQIKNAVSGSDMQQSIMDQNSDAYSPGSMGQGQEDYVPTPQPPQDNSPYQSQTQGYAQEAYQTPQYQDQNYQNYGQQDYGQYPEQYSDYAQGQDSYYPDESFSDNSSVIDIADQVVSEKTKKIQKQVEDLMEFKSLAENSLKLMEERLRRIETTIDKLQISILDKIGSYGKNLSEVKKEMSMMQDSFSKVVNPILDKSKRK